MTVMENTTWTTLDEGDRSWHPPAKSELLAILRGDRRSRRSVDVGLASGLKSWLEDGIFALIGDDESPPLHLDKATVARAGTRPSHWVDGEPSVELLRSVLATIVFRQVVTAGPMEHAFAAATAVLEADPVNAELICALDSLDSANQHHLESEIERIGRNLHRRWPELSPNWLPRTGVRMSQGLGGGRVVLRGTADLLIGTPSALVASVALVCVRPVPLHPLHREELTFLALLETLRTGTPPFRAINYSLLTGEVEALDVDDAMLTSAVERTLSTIEVHQHVGRPS